ncbi:MAG: hypothetical protein ACLUKQ_10605 [Peptococcaceae bacterium]
MKFDSTLVTVEEKEIVIVAVDTHFFVLPQEEKNALVRNFFEYFRKPIVLMAVNQQGDMQYFGRPDLTAMVANLKFNEFKWQTNEIAD